MNSRWGFAGVMIGLGIVGLVTGHFTPTWSGVPAGLPGRTALAYVCALVSLGCGVALVWPGQQYFAAVASRLLLAFFALWFVLFRVPPVLKDPTSSGNWWGCGESAVMGAAAWVLYARFNSGFATGERGVRIARMLLGLGVIPFGIAHFTFLERTVSLVPGYLPGHLAWAYFTGGAFIAAGLGVLTGIYPRLAATLLLVQLVLFTLLVWVPILLGTPTASDWSEFIQSCALTAAVWVVAETYRGMPWLAVSFGRRGS